MTAIAWAWSIESSLNERCGCAQRLVAHFGLRDSKGTSWQAFAEILRTHTDYLREQLILAFHAKMAGFSSFWMTGRYVVFGVDGTDVSVARTAANQAAFTTDGKSKHQRRTKTKNKNKHQQKMKDCPRILMATIYHLKLALPWDWRLGSKSDNERGLFLDMLGGLPKHALVVCDAGFSGYSFLAESMQSGVELIVRVGSNVSLLKKLGSVRESGGLVYIWPKWAQNKNIEPLVFRLVVINGGKHPLYLIVSVLDRDKLCDREVATIYGDRWGIEVYHRNLKQTFGKRKLLCRSPANVTVELQWSVLSYCSMLLYTVDQQKETNLPPARISVSAVLRAFRQTARDYLHPITRSATLNQKLKQATSDDYKRNSSKESRDYPKRRGYKPPGKPNIATASRAQRMLAALSLTA